MTECILTALRREAGHPRDGTTARQFAKAVLGYIKTDDDVRRFSRGVDLVLDRHATPLPGLTGAVNVRVSSLGWESFPVASMWGMNREVVVWFAPAVGRPARYHEPIAQAGLRLRFWHHRWSRLRRLWDALRVERERRKARVRRSGAT